MGLSQDQASRQDYVYIVVVPFNGLPYDQSLTATTFGVGRVSALYFLKRKTQRKLVNHQLVGYLGCWPSDAHPGLTTKGHWLSEKRLEMLKQFQFIPAEGRRSQCQGTGKQGCSSKKQFQECFPRLYDFPTNTCELYRTLKLPAK